MLVWRVLADLRKVEVRCDEDAFLPLANSDDLRVGHATKLLLEDRERVVSSLLKDRGELNRQVLTV
jgi:hypothetical protein